MDTLDISPSVQRLIDHFDEEYDNDLVWQRDEVYRSVLDKNPTLPAARRFALAFKTFLDTKNVVVRPYHLLAGHGQYINPSATMPVVLAERFDPRNAPKNHFDVKREIRCHKEYAGDSLTAEDAATLAYFSDGIDCGLFKRWAALHTIGGYEYIVRESYAAFEERITGRLQEVSEKEERDYLEAMLVSIQAARNYIRRYAAAARETRLHAADEQERKALSRIETACGNLADKPAENFFEAVQSVWLLHEMITYESMSGAISIGRLDQILYPYYAADLAAGIITPDEAQELIEALWLKLASIVQGFQNVTLGGCDAQRKPSVNDVTFFCLRASRKLGRDQPLVSLRWTKEMPAELWEEALALISKGGGFPALFNDEVIIKARETLGVKPEDARDYGIIGCVEPTAGGREYSNTEELRINWTKVLELMLSGGRCGITGKILHGKLNKDLDAITSFDEFYSWFRQEFDYTVRQAIRACNLLDTSYPVFFPIPFMSVTIRGCIERGQDAAACGPVYRFSSANGCGMANLADSLSALRQVVFEEKRLTLSQFAAALEKDYVGYEDLLAHINSHCPKYGNDEHRPDEILRQVTDLFCEIVNGSANNRGFRYQVGLYTVDDQASMGRKTGASADGRKSGTALANAICPVQGVDRHGPTATINSVTKLDFIASGNGMVLDIKFSPDFFQKTEHRNVLRPFIESYFEKGGMEIQFNVVSRETLLAAKKNPAQYKNFLVRVSGFSAYFITLDPLLQDEIINRTEFHGV